MLDRLQHYPPNSGVYLDDPSHAKIGIHPLPGRLYVVTMLENPLRWRARYSNYWAFQHHVETSGAILYTAEVAFGERQHEITDPDNPRHIQIRAEQQPWVYELWHKENILNLAMQRLPADWKYVAWLDADVQFVRPDWAQETLHLLQHYQFLQMFSHTQDLGPNDEPLGSSVSFVMGREKNPDLAGSQNYYSGASYYGKQGGLWSWPGLAWAARRDALNQVGGLIDWSILGSGDWLMACALFGDVKRALANNGYHPNFCRKAYEWQARAEKYIRRNVGYMPGLIVHHWHGRKRDRNYDKRWKLLVQAKYDPEKDLIRDTAGMWRLSDRSRELRDGLRKYAALRNEDASEV